MNNFIKMSKYAGMREDLVQAGGGNSAFKISPDKMAIKASGYQLADLSVDEGYAIVNPKVIREAFLNDDILNNLTDEMSKKILKEAFIEGARPSIETFLHSISGKYSLHTHPIVVNALTCRKDGKKILKELFPDSLIVDYATPGAPLAKSYFLAYKEYKLQYDKEPQFVFLMNHGFITSADTADEVIELTEYVTSNIEEYLNVDNSSYHIMQNILDLYEDGIIWKVTDQNIIRAKSVLGYTWQHWFCPDSVVFLGQRMCEIKDTSTTKESFLSFVEENGYPVVITYNDNMYIHASSVKKAMEIQSVLSFDAQVMTLNDGKECQLLSQEEKNFLLNWDAEKYRRNMK